MRGGALRLRPWVDADFDLAAEIQREAFPEESFDGDDFRRIAQVERSVPGPKAQVLVEEVSTGRPVGWAQLHGNAFQPDARNPWISGIVRPSDRGRGAGRLLFDHVRSAAERGGADHLRTSTRTDTPGPEFLLRRGFRERRRSQILEIEFGSASARRPESVPTPPVGVRLTSLAAEGPSREAVRRALYALDVRAAADMPRIDPTEPVTYEAFRDLLFENPKFDPEGCYLAVAGEQYVGLSYGLGDRSRSDVYFQALTATLPDYRGRGIAIALKREVIEHARRAGYRAVQTMNDTENAAILRVNERLGFRPIRTVLRLELDLVRESPAAPAAGAYQRR